MKRCALILWLACCLASHVAPAQPDGQAAADGDRYLFVVDTSLRTAAMKETLRNTVYDLIFSGLNGQLKRGDSLGIWAFNDQVYPQPFPPLNWAPDQNARLAAVAYQFLKDQRFQRRSRLDVLFADLNRVIKGSQTLVVLVLTDGSGTFQGTPFDDPINALSAARSAALQQEGKPLITILTSRGGEIVAWTAGTVGEPLLIPKPPPPQPAAEVPKPVSPSALSKQAVAEAEPADEPRDEGLTATAPVPSDEVVRSGPAPLQAEATAEPPTLPDLQTNTVAEAVPACTSTEIGLAAVPEPTAPPDTLDAREETPKTENEQPDEAGQGAPPPPEPEASPQAAPVAEQPRVFETNHVAGLELATPSAQSAFPQTPANVLAKADSPASPDPEVEPKEREEPEKNVATSAPPIEPPAPVPPASSAAPASTQLGNVQPAREGPPLWSLLFIGLGLLLAAILLIILLVRLNRPRRQPSFISRSIDRRGH